MHGVYVFARRLRPPSLSERRVRPLLRLFARPQIFAGPVRVGERCVVWGYVCTRSEPTEVLADTCRVHPLSGKSRSPQRVERSQSRASSRPDLGGSRALTETSLTHARRLFLPSPKKRAIRPPSDPAMRSYVREYASLGAGRRRCAVYHRVSTRGGDTSTAE